MDFLRKTYVFEVPDGVRQPGGKPTGSLDPPPFGECECMDFLRKTYVFEVLDGVRQPGGKPTGSLDPPPLGE